MGQHDPPTATHGVASGDKELRNSAINNTSLEPTMQSDTTTAGAGIDAAAADDAIPPPPSLSPMPTDEPAATAVVSDPLSAASTAVTHDASSGKGSDAGPSPLMDLPQEVFDLMTTSLHPTDLRELRDVSVECARKVRKVFARRAASHRILLCDTNSLGIAAEASLDPDFASAMLSSLILDIAELKYWDAETALQENRVLISLTAERGLTYYFPLVQVSDDEDSQSSDDEDSQNSDDEDSQNSDDEDSQNSDDGDSQASYGDKFHKRVADKKDRKRNEIISSLRQTVPELNRLKCQQSELREFNLDFHLLTAVFRNLRAYGDLQSLEIAWPDFHVRYDDFGPLGLYRPDWDDTRPLRIIFQALTLSGLSPRAIKMPHSTWYPPPDIISEDQTLLDHMRTVLGKVESVDLTLGVTRFGHLCKQLFSPQA